MPPEGPAVSKNVKPRQQSATPFAPKREISAPLLSEGVLEQPVLPQGKSLGWRNHPPTVKTEMG